MVTPRVLAFGEIIVWSYQMLLNALLEKHLKKTCLKNSKEIEQMAQYGFQRMLLLKK